jgi:hypothetical protein
VRRCAWSRNLVNEETLAHWRAVAPKTNSSTVHTVGVCFIVTLYTGSTDPRFTVISNCLVHEFCKSSFINPHRSLVRISFRSQTNGPLSLTGSQFLQHSPVCEPFHSRIHEAAPFTNSQVQCRSVGRVAFLSWSTDLSLSPVSSSSTVIHGPRCVCGVLHRPLL